MSSSLLRFITAGSVDDGKSTLIGRLLYDSKGIFTDQLEALSRSQHKHRPINEDGSGGLDLSQLTDGLEAEREQGITIDVAYRYFSTPQRKFIIADTPGHEEYTRNMITAASTADAIVILVDAAQMKASPGLLVQTKRHSSIAQLLKIENVILAVNKMDLVNFEQSTYDRIVQIYQEFAVQLGLKNIRAIPLSALRGDNVVRLSSKMLWYKGPPLIGLLESLTSHREHRNPALRFPVQWVNSSGLCGRVESGQVLKGQTLLTQPCGHSVTVKDIVTLEGSQSSAQAGQSVILELEENLDILRGEMLVNIENPPMILRSLDADLCWLSEDPLDANRSYWLKHTSMQTHARVTGIESLLDINTQQRRTAKNLKLNDIARVSIQIEDPLVADAYAMIRATGSFILIDEVTHQTAAAGMIRF